MCLILSYDIELSIYIYIYRDIDIDIDIVHSAQRGRTHTHTQHNIIYDTICICTRVIQKIPHVHTDPCWDSSVARNVQTNRHT